MTVESPDPRIRDERWYALYTRHQHEKAISHSLEGKGITTFLPVYAATHQWKDRAKELLLPLFPCYVFVRCVDGANWSKILATPGIHAVVSFAGQPAEIPEQELEAVRRAVQSRLEIEPYPFLNCGDWVRVMTGALAGVEGYLVRKKNLFRLVLSVEMLGKSAAVEVDRTAVQPTARPDLGSANGGVVSRESASC